MIAYCVHIYTHASLIHSLNLNPDLSIEYPLSAHTNPHNHMCCYSNHSINT